MTNLGVSQVAVVKFNASEFFERYPEFVDKLTEGQLLQCFEIACLICNNTDTSLIPYDPDNMVYTRKTLLYMLMCHMCALALRPYDQAGAISSTSQGSISVSFQIPTADSAYFNQTHCGATYWQLMKQFGRGGHLFTHKHHHPFG